MFVVGGTSPKLLQLFSHNISRNCVFKLFQALVLNTHVNHQWQHEERPPGFPLGNGQPTQITAVASDYSFDIYGKNRQQFCYSYRHRYDVSKINQVQCVGQGIPVKAYMGRVRVCVCVRV